MENKACKIKSIKSEAGAVTFGGEVDTEGAEVDTEGAEVDAGSARGHTLEHDESLQQE